MYSMQPGPATRNRACRWFGGWGSIRALGRWYVPRALGESGTNAGIRRLRGAEARIATGIAVVTLAAGMAACGGGQRQDVTEPSGSFPVTAKGAFPSHQRLAQTSDLVLAVRNAGDRTIPDLAVTIYTLGAKGGASVRTKAGVTATGSGQGSFNIRLNDPNLSSPSRPVWVLENDYPKLLTGGITPKNVAKAPSAGAAAAQTDTFQFGAVPPGESKKLDWRLTAVSTGTYTVHYQVAAGLQGKAKAVTRGGTPVKDEFAVTISPKPPQTCVNGAGQVVPLNRCGP